MCARQDMQTLGGNAPPILAIPQRRHGVGGRQPAMMADQLRGDVHADLETAVLGTFA